MKPKVSYEFNLDADPSRFVVMKTNKKKSALRKVKDQLDFDHTEKAKDILDRNIIDGQYYLSVAQYNQLTDFEMKLYHTESCYMIKLPQYVEKYTCGIYMEESLYKVYDK
jgi:hypothetical protein